MTNPFKFGTVVEKEFFTDREKESSIIATFLSGQNHLIIISPRRYGKTSLILRVSGALKRPVIYLDLQSVTDTVDLANMLMKRVMQVSKWESLKKIVAGFRVTPTVELNPATNTVSVSFAPFTKDKFEPLSDVLNLIEKIGESGKKPLVILDEFQEIEAIDTHLAKLLRSILQHHSHVNYVFLGSAESMMRQIFEDKKSPFYHFGHLMTLDKIPYEDFFTYLESRFSKITNNSTAIAESILQFTGRHPYYTQQLAFYCYAYLQENEECKNLIDVVADWVIEIHNLDYEKLWGTMNRTDKKILTALIEKKGYTETGLATSTVYSCLAKLARQGFLIKNTTYEPDDPFFAKWIMKKRA
ncbi:MAG: ATP-binding protein [Lachnospiraceae bacterium]|jgi:AAA+ ATPase superfamily predicted ATPase|nr:ATP-binding protein [Lachnospiraceae bacterium]